MATLNRAARRAAAKQAARAGINTVHNGISHGALTRGSFARLEAHLCANGNRLSEQHRAALFAMLGLFTESAQGKLPGRWAFGLPTGMGKTSAIIAWCAALVSQGHDHISVSVAASKVEALCQLKRDMITHGIPEERIGLLYADGGRYSEPRTDDNSERQIMLVSHARVRSRTGLARFNSYQGRPRDLMLYDESLIASDAKGVSVRELRAALGFLQGLWLDNTGYAPCLAYLTQAQQAIHDALDTARATPNEPTVIALPEIDDQQLGEFRRMLPRRPAVAPLFTLLDLAKEQLRVLPTDDGGAVWYEVSVPAELRNIIVLDASYPIRALVKADSTIRDAEQHLPAVKRIGVSLSQLKTFDNVALHQMFVAGGRESMRRDFERDHGDRRTTREVVEIVKNVPPDESVLIFVFKHKHGERVDYRSTMLADLEKAGIDTTAKVRGVENGEPKDFDRINVVTWGMETSLNSFAHCRHVILAGVLQRSSLDLAGAYIGQANDLRSDVPSKTIRQVARSEVCHVIYQALSRGACRVIEDGKASRMTGYIIHRDPAIRGALSEVMPGAVWKGWEPVHSEAKAGTVATTASRIAQFLAGLPGDVDRISTRKLKDAAGLRGVAGRSFTHALRDVSSLVPWALSGRSLARLFTPHPT
ncbi:MAG: hypothetical protein J0J01_09005 [Reyranella sp.]|uniref:hypothetical protein n=1 Tax=Reyranella sp. TaxID=1929291 RepID=UPI001AD0C70F|nr:hypothetical protein [Reyranella sp.]MBN9087032.1 hypothetical protein [Reyranella sp.]